MSEDNERLDLLPPPWWAIQALSAGLFLAALYPPLAKLTGRPMGHSEWNWVTVAITTLTFVWVAVRIWRRPDLSIYRTRVDVVHVWVVATVFCLLAAFAWFDLLSHWVG